MAIDRNSSQVKTAVDSWSTLRPVELAYLAIPSDSLHFVLVMAVDVIQRYAKSTMSGSRTPPLLDYEIKMWEITQTYFKETFNKKIEPYLPNQLTLEPIQYVKRLSALYLSFLNLIRSFSKEVIKDPKQLRKYFSLTGVLHLVADFFAYGYQDALNNEFTLNLVEKQLLVPSRNRKRFSVIFLWCAAALGLLDISLTSSFLPPSLAVAVPLATALSALSICLAMYLRNLLPFYPEFAELINHIRRKDWRVSLIRTIIRLLDLISWAMVAGIFLLDMAIGGGLLKVILPSFTLAELEIMAISTITLIICFDFAARGLAIKNAQVPTMLGKKLLTQARKGISKVSPMAAFRKTLESDQYDPLLSEIVAIYGIAPLIILA